MIQYKKAEIKDIPVLMDIRLETLRNVFKLPPDHPFETGLVEKSREYFSGPNQSSVLAFDSGTVIGCATMCYLDVPTMEHPSGFRGHLMNVYTKQQYRRRGIARKMVETLIDEARKKGATEITLDATEEGRPLYKKLGFSESTECMVLNL